MPNTFASAGRLPRVGAMRGVAAPDASALLGNEWSGFALDFLGDTYTIRTTNGAERLLGDGPGSAEIGLGLDFTDNSSALGI